MIKTLTPQNKTEYKKINGCTKELQCEQIFWAFGMIALLVMYSVFSVPPMISWKSTALIVFMAITYFLFLIAIYDYIKLTITDPVDQRIKGVHIDGETKYCSRCNKDVGIKTYHCNRCRRCTDQLDHHSVLVNNCISLKDIVNYLRLNFCFLLILCTICIESLILFGFSFDDASLRDSMINRWVILFIGTVASFAIPVSFYNLVSSFYIRFSRQQSKILYFYRQRESNHSDIESTDKMESAKSVNSDK